MSGKPAARQGDMTRKGLDIVQGSASVLIGAPTGVACSVCPGGITYANPVNPVLGAKVLPGETDLALPCPLPFILFRAYSSYPAYINPVVDLISEAHQATVSEFNCPFGMKQNHRRARNGDFFRLVITNCHRHFNHAVTPQCAPLIAFNTQHLAIVGQYVVMYQPCTHRAIGIASHRIFHNTNRRREHTTIGFVFAWTDLEREETIAANLFTDSGQRIKVRRKSVDIHFRLQWDHHF